MKRSIHLPQLRRAAIRSIAAAAALTLCGCASQRAYDDGKSLVAQGRIAEGLERLEEAARTDPDVAQYRIGVLQARARLAADRLSEVEALRRTNRLAEAVEMLRSILSDDPFNERARASLHAIELQVRTAVLLTEAKAAAARRDVDTARAKLAAITTEDPRHEGARRLLQELQDLEARPRAQAELSQAYKKPITIEFKDAPLRSVFEVISRSSGLNFIFDKDVRGDQKTSIFLKNSTIEAAVNLTLLTNQLEQRVLDGNTVLIYPNTPAKQKDYQPLTVRSFYLANADAKTVAATLKSLLKTRDVVVDEKLNMLIVRDGVEAIRLAEKLVALHDVPEPEVMLEVEILEVKRTRLLDLGIRWPDQLGLSPLPGVAGGALTVADLRNLNSTRIGAGIGGVTLNVKKNDTDANILANPRIRARNREKAKILIGERVPNITATSTSTGFVAESVTYVDVGLKLDVEPTVYLDGEVAIRIALEVSNIISQIQSKSGSIAYQIGTRTAQTVLRLRDGENQVLAGLINDEDRRTAYKVPGLGEAPVLGRLFGSQADDSSKTEIVLSITPRIIRNVRRPEASLIEFESGTETSLGARPAAAPVSSAPTAPGPASTAVPGRTAEASPASQPAQNPLTSSSLPATTNDGAVAGSLPAPAVVRWQGPTQLRVGDTFALQLLMQSDQPVVSLPLAVGFDPRLLQATSVAEGNFMKQGGAQSTFTSRIDPAGQILATVTRSGETGASAPGTVATVNFRVMGAVTPETQIQLQTVAPIGLGGRAIAAPLPAHHTIRIGANEAKHSDATAAGASPSRP